MPALSDRVRETSTTTGTGTFSLAGAVTGFVSFSSAFGNGVSVYYVAALGAEWEIGIGTTGAGTLSRDTVIASSAGGTTKVTFSAGAKDVFCSIPATGLVTTDDVASTNTANKVVKRDGSGNFAAGTITAALTGNASTATALQTARNINGVSFNGTADITVAAAAGTLTGNTLASGVTASNLTSVGTLANLTVTNTISGSVSGSAATLATTRTLWGQNFNGSANVTGALASVGDITGTAGVTLTATAGTLTLAATSANIVQLTTNGTARWNVNGSGHLLANADNSFDIGASGASRPRDVFVGTAVTTPSVTNAGTLALSASSTNIITLSTNGVERARVPSAGGVQVVGALSVGNVAPTTSGAGITFPATQSASSDANTLDDYEEGTWTPTYAFSTSGSVTTASEGRYTKIGRVVVIEARIYTTAISSPTGNATITGLPFTAASVPGYHALAIGEVELFNTDMPNLRARISGSSIEITKNATNAGTSLLQGADFVSGGGRNILTFFACYIV
jgi:hypothetical protein